MCQTNPECPSGVCNMSNGNCVDPSMIYLVDNGGMTIAACDAARPTRNGNTAATAYCDISEAPQGSRAYILVTGHGKTFPYSPFAVNGPQIFVGPGYKAAMPAVISGTPTGNAAITMSNIASVTIDGFEITTGAGNKEGIDCSSTKSTVPHNMLTVRNSYIHDNSGFSGIAPSGCDLLLEDSWVATSGARNIDDTGTSGFAVNVTINRSRIESAGADGMSINGILTLDRSLIINNSAANGNGVQVNNATFTITNNFFYLNNQAVEFNLPSPGTAASVFMFNTVARNTRGFSCA